ncbi:MAG: hypothetical protein QW228_09465 [Candidatus Aenigmatarchaeota archaeon]
MRTMTDEELFLVLMSKYNNLKIRRKGNRWKYGDVFEIVITEDEVKGIILNESEFEKLKLKLMISEL